MKQRTHIDEKLFRAVKIMLAGGATYEEIAEYFNIGLSSVGRIRKYDTLEECRQQEAAIALAYKKRKAQARLENKPEVKQEEKPVTPAPVEAPKMSYMPYATQVELMRLLKEQNETLKLISNKLVFIVEQLA